MIGESLVIFACVTSHGCDETSNQYFLEHPTIKIQLDDDAKKIRKFIGPQFVDNVGPMLFVIAGGTGLIHLHEHFDLRIRRDAAILSFNLPL